MKKAVMYGAGNIGRGFIGKMFSESGYEVCFIDKVEDIVCKLNEDRSYPVKIVLNDLYKEEIVYNVRAVSGTDMDKIAEEITTADIMSTAVGVNVLPKIIKPICLGLKKRFSEGGEPLNIIICENLINADKYLRKMIEEEMGPEYKEVLDKKLGLVEASIGRMVPVMTKDMQEGNILRVWVEPYAELPIDKEAFIGKIPDLQGLIPFAPFGYFIKRKLYIHNLGHAICAYAGWQKGYKYIYECIADDEIRTQVSAAMLETANALHKEYSISLEELTIHVEDLITRFANRALGDTVTRVGRDPLRKLGKEDRLAGAALYCIAQGVEPKYIIKGIIAGLRYRNIEDESANEMQLQIEKKGIEEFVEGHCGIDKETELFKKVINQYNEIIN